MESGKITKLVAPATNESADHNEEGAAADHGEPSSSNIQSQDDQHLRSLLTGLHKDQLVDILVLQSMKIPQVAEGLRAAARPTASHRKLIVHGFGEETTLETLTKAFSNSYGEVEDANVTVDRTTGKSRGFGYVTFKSLESVKKALEKQKTWVDGHLARQHPPSQAEINSDDLDKRKLFVTRISSDVTNEMFHRFFEKYGEIEGGSVIFDRFTRTSTGLGFVTFKTVEAAQAAIADPDKILGGNRISVEIRRFIKKRNEDVQEEEESVASNNIAPYVRNRNIPYAINRPSQQYGRLQSQFQRPHFIRGYEPYGIPVAYRQPPTGTYQQYLISGYEPYGIPVAYQQAPTAAYQQAPTAAYQSLRAAYQPHFGGYEPAYGMPIAMPYQPQFIGHEPAYGIPIGYQLPPSRSVSYQRPPTGFMAYPYYFSYQ